MVFVAVVVVFASEVERAQKEQVVINRGQYEVSQDYGSFGEGHYCTQLSFCL